MLESAGHALSLEICAIDHHRIILGVPLDLRSDHLHRLGFPESNLGIYWERLSYTKRAFLCESRVQVFVPVGAGNALGGATRSQRVVAARSRKRREHFGPASALHVH